MKIRGGVIINHFCRMLCRGCPKSIKVIFASLHFAKVLIARRATTFGKVDYPDYQSLL